MGLYTEESTTMKYLSTYEYYILPINRKDTMVKRFKKSTITMSEDETVDYVLKNCTEWVKKPINIKRGIDENYDFFYSKPIKRWSRDCQNYYTLIMDNAPAWSDYPKRSKSFICSFYRTREGSDSYYVIPEDGSNWGIVPDDDIYGGFLKMMIDKYDINLGIHRFFLRFADIINDNLYGNIILSDTNWNEFKKTIKILQQNVDKVPKDKFSKVTTKEEKAPFLQFKNIEKNIIKSENIFNTLLDIINPLSGFKNYTYEKLQKINIDKYLNRWNECWTDSPCVFVNEDNYESFMEKINLKK